jgi:site-specific DNA-methyltransferase (adenine-specific)
MKDCFVDLTLTSPPYDDMRAYHEYSFDVKKVAQELFRVTKTGGVVVWIVSDKTSNGSESGTSFKQALTFMEKGFRLMDTMIFKKPPKGASGNNRIYWQGFEYMFVFTKGAPKTINLIKDRKNKESRNGDNGTKRLVNGKLKKVARGGYGEYGRRTNVWEYAVGKGHSSKDPVAFEHPAIFPENLAKDHILSWSNPNDIVYDCFMGSGTTAKMALLTNRNYIGSEISSVYCDLANRRLMKYSNEIESNIQAALDHSIDIKK